MKRFTLLVPLCLLAAGCATLGANDTQQQEIQALKARLLELQREAAMNQVEMAQLRQQVAELEARNGGARPGAAAPSRPSASTSPAPPPAATRSVVEPPRSAVPAVRPAPSPAEPIEEVDIELPDDQPQPPPRRTPPALPVPAPSRTAAPPPAPSPAPPATAPAVPDEEPAPETLSPANQVLYDRGYSLYYQGHFVDAETSFQRFLQANPASELADNAQYWIGECRYARNDLKGALAAFRETIERYPKGNKAADALLKSGQCLEGLGDIEGARVTYREVVRRFPGTLTANAAEERRAKLP